MTQVMTKLLCPRRIYCCCSGCCCPKQQGSHRHVWRKTVVFGIFVFSLYFALLSFVSFLAVSNHRSGGSSLRVPITPLHFKNGSRVDLSISGYSSMGRFGDSNGTRDVGMLTIERTGVGSNVKYSVHSSSVSRRDSAFATDVIRSQTIFKCVPVHYREKPGPAVALASFPGSGNTWLRYLLQLSTGIFTGSVYKDFALLRNGFPGESVKNGRVLVVKTHESGSSARSQFHKAILLVRKPSEAILAEFNRRAAGHIGHAGRDKYTRNAGRYWSTFVAQKAKSWTETNLDWIEGFTGPLLITMYHQLVHNTSQELSTILDFLGEPVSEGIMFCVMSNKEGIYRRRKKNAQFNPFTPKMEKFLAAQERIVFNAIQKRINADTASPTTPLSLKSSSYNHNNKNKTNNLSNITRKLQHHTT